VHEKVVDEGLRRRLHRYLEADVLRIEEKVQDLSPLLRPFVILRPPRRRLLRRHRVRALYPAGTAALPGVRGATSGIGPSRTMMRNHLSSMVGEICGVAVADAAVERRYG